MVHAGSSVPASTAGIHLPACSHKAFWSYPHTSHNLIATMYNGLHLIRPCASSRRGHLCPHGPVPIVFQRVSLLPKRLQGANPSCHCSQWMSTNLSPFMTRVQTHNQLHPRQTAPYTHTRTAGQQLAELHQISQAC